MTDNTTLLLLLPLFLIAALGLLKSLLPSGLHIRYRRRAVRALDRINSGKKDYQGWIFRYLRKMNPMVFEELLLEAFKRKGYEVIRNRRYTGDGGLDGKVIIDGKPRLIQAKRYSSYINPGHVRAFDSLCTEKGTTGFFIHTGKTGQGARDFSHLSGRVTIISGDRLLDLLLKERKFNQSN